MTLGCSDSNIWVNFNSGRDCTSGLMEYVTTSRGDIQGLSGFGRQIRPDIISNLCDLKVPMNGLIMIAFGRLI